MYKKEEKMIIKDNMQLQEYLPKLKILCIKMLETTKYGIKLSVEKFKPKRTCDQNSFYWLNCGDIAKFLTNAGCFIVKMGYKCKWKKDDVHDVNKERFNVDSTSKLSKKEFIEYMEGMFAFWQEKTDYEWEPLDSSLVYLNEFNK